MKRFISMILCLCMLFSFCFARAELEVPQLQPTRGELQASFISKLLFGVLPKLSLNSNALQLDLSQAEQPLLSALLQQVDGVYDINGTVQGMPFRAQLTADAILVDWAGQVYRVPYENLKQLSVGVGDGQVMASINPQEVISLVQGFVETAILPSVNVEGTENGIHMSVDLTQERLAGGLVGVGDAIAGSEQMVQLINTLGVGRFDEFWPGLRGMIEGGLIQVFLKADATIEGGVVNATAEGSLMGQPFNLSALIKDGVMDFRFETNENSVISVRSDIATGAYECHTAGFGEMDFDAAFAPNDEGWTYNVLMAQGGMTVLSCDAALTAASFDADFSCLVDVDSIVGKVHFDRATQALDAHITCPESMGAMAFDIAGEAMETGYHAVIHVKQGEADIAIADLAFTNTEEVVGLEATVTDASEQPATLMTLTAAYARETGAISLRYDDAQDDYCEGHGVMTAERQSCTLEMGMGDQLTQRVVFDRVSNDRQYTYRFTVSEDTLFRGTMDVVNDIVFDLDKASGAFRGSVRQPGGNYSAQGVVTDGLFRLRLDASEFYWFAGMMDVNAHWDESGVTADFTFNDGRDVAAASLMWTPALKTLNLDGDDLSLYAALQQGDFGIPKAFRAALSNDGHDINEISIDERGVVVNINGEYTTVTDYYRDDSTCCIDINSTHVDGMPGDAIHAVFTAEDDAINVAVTDGEGQKLFEGRLASAEPGDFEALDGRENVIELTAEDLQAMLYAAADAGTAQEPAQEDEPAEEAIAG